MSRSRDTKKALRIVGEDELATEASRGSGIEEQPRVKRPPCPGWFSPEQRREFLEICRRLEAEDLLGEADVGAIRNLAIAQDKLRQVTEFLNENGNCLLVSKVGRPYRCPACKGTGIRPEPEASGEEDEPPVVVVQDELSRGRRCSVCLHRDREKINEALRRGESLRSVARQFATSKDALSRHRKSHLDDLPAAGGMVVRPVRRERPCKACGGKGAIIPRERVERVQYPEVTQQRHAQEEVRKQSAILGLDPASRTKIRGKGKQRRASSGLQAYKQRRAARQ